MTKQFLNDAIGRSSGISVIGRNAVLFRGDRANHLSGAAREGSRKIAPRRLPKVFLVNGIVAAVAGLLAAEPLPSALLLASAATMIVVRFGAISVINQARDAMVGGDGPAGRKFERWHRRNGGSAVGDSNSAVAASMIDDSRSNLQPSTASLKPIWLKEG